MFISWLHFLFLLTLTMIAARVITIHVVEKYPGSATAQALSFIFG